MHEETVPTITWAQKKKALARHLMPHKRILIALSVAGVVSAAANAIVPYVTGLFFDTLIRPTTIKISAFGAYDGWLVLLVLWAVAQLVANSIGWWTDRRSRLLTTRLEGGLQAGAFEHLLKLPIAFHKKNRSGEVTETFSKASWQLAGMTNIFLSLTSQFLTIFIGIVISFYIYAPLAWILLIGLAVYLLILARVVPGTARLQEEAHKTWNRAWSDGVDAYTNVQTVKQAGAEIYEGGRIADAYYKKAFPLWLRHEYTWGKLNFSQRVIVTVTQGAVLLYSVTLVTSGTLTIGELIAFNAYAGMIIGPFVSLGTQWQTIQNGVISLARSEIVFGTDPELYEPPNAIGLPHLKGEVQFDQVRFTYEAGQPEILQGISFTVKPGEVVAFVGETGVGKSTAIELISGYYFATQGKVLIDGHDVRNVNLYDLRRGIGIVPQEVVLFNAPIKENIRYARPEATDAEIEEVAKNARADVFIEKFPQKYEQEVGERGVKLSVGQKQRVAIARAMLRNPQILILDEPTSALDPETEKYITASLEELMRGRTTFIIAHRLSTVRKADKIIVLKEGKVAEIGNHQELMSLDNGVYRHLYELHIGLHE
jgi:ABC-type multidrug transport system fused ATPase/permease subunit